MAARVITTATITVDKTGNHLFDLLMYQREGKGQFQLYRARTTVSVCRKLREISIIIANE
jgi:hypothetical protein